MSDEERSGGSGGVTRERARGSVEAYASDKNQAGLVTQQAFREVTDAMARPGRVHRIPPAKDPLLKNPYFETLLIMLVDSGCRFEVAAPERDALISRIVMLTYAMPAPPDSADFVFVAALASREQAARLIAGLSGGNLAAPHRGATVVVECDRLAQEAEEAARYGFSARGPGIRGSHAFFASSDGWFDARTQRCDEFPCGIDFILVDRYANVVCIPRTTTVECVLSPSPRMQNAQGGR
jgi:alpha-D-ribose 1-methylphosphonate 5-triphosphate synthase subunit PhnH